MTGIQLKALLSKKKVNLSDLGRFGGLSRQNIDQKLKSPDENVPFNRLVAKYLNIPLRHLIPDEVDENTSGNVSEPEHEYCQQPLDMKEEMMKILNDNTTLVRIIEDRNNLIVKLLDEKE